MCKKEESMKKFVLFVILLFYTVFCVAGEDFVVSDDSSSVIFEKCFVEDGFLKIEYNLNKRIPVEIEVWNCRGNRMFKHVIGGREKNVILGKNFLSYSVSKYDPGIYFCTIKIDKESETRKVFLDKK